jgi:hypothetical protein
LIHRDVRFAEEVDGIAVTGPTDGNADTGGDEDLPTIDHEGLLELVAQALGNPDDVGRIGNAFEQNREVITTEARRGVAGAQDVFQSAGDGLQKAVAGLVAEAVIDDLEAVDIEEDDADPFFVTLRPFQAVVSRSMKRARFGRSVSGSWKA